MSWMRDQQANKLKKARQTGTGGFNSVPDVTTKAGREDTFMQAACKMDWDRLKTIPDHAERNKLKPALLDKYKSYLDQWTHEHRQNPAQNDVLIRNLIWACDAEDWCYARNLADACAVTKQVMTLMERNCCTFFVDAIVQSAEKGSHNPYIYDVMSCVPGRIETDPNWAVNHIAKAKLYRILAKHAKDEDPPTALRYATAAHDAYPNVGVKTLIEDLRRKISLAAPPPQATGEVTTEGVASSPIDVVADPGTPVFLDK